jgi:hypothetical protein
MTKKSHAHWLAAALFLGAGLHVHAQEASQGTPAQNVVVLGQRNVSKWFLAESPHFIVYSDTTEEDVTSLLNNLERLDYLLRIYAKDYIKSGGMEQKLTLYYHGRVAGFKQISADQPADAIGLYNSCAARVQGFGVRLERDAELHNEQLVKQPLDEGLSYIFEAYARHFLYRHTDIRTPVSFIEGFAQYFSSVRFSDTRMVLGRVPTNVGKYLHFLDDGHRYSLEYSDILELNDERRRNYAGPAGVQLEFEAKSWILTHYMLSSEENRNHLRNYLGQVYHDAAPAQAFESAFGLKAKDISNAMWRYRLNSVQVLQVDLPALPKAVVKFSSLPQATGDFVIADARLKSCPQQPEGEALLRALTVEAGKFPGNDFAQLVLSRAQIDWGNAQDALPWLNKAIDKNGANFDALYLAGLANFRLAERSNDANRRTLLDASRSSLLRACSLDPKSTEAALALLKSEVLANDQPDVSALEGVIAIWQGTREVPALARSAALAQAYLGNSAKAASILKSMRRTTHSPQLAAWAENWQSRLDAGVSGPDILAEMRLAPSPNPAFKEWTIDNDSVMQTVVYNAGLENAQGILDKLSQDPNPEKALHNMPVGR